MIPFKCVCVLVLIGGVALFQGAAHASKVRQLYSFSGSADGGYPDGKLLVGKEGVLYGTASAGGALCPKSPHAGCGTIYLIGRDGVLTVLHTFQGGKRDGANPGGGLIKGKSGALYGTAIPADSSDCGIIFKLNRDNKLKVVYAFRGSSNKDGCFPQGDIIADGAGNLYGTMVEGGVGEPGYGTVFKIGPDGSESELYVFQNGLDGDGPNGGLVRDDSGTLYGTTMSGGAKGAGTAFSIAADGSETVLYSFSGGNDGGYPAAGLTMDATSNLYGTTFDGGAENDGVVFKLTPSGDETVLYSFTGGPNGTNPTHGEAPESS